MIEYNNRTKHMPDYFGIHLWMACSIYAFVFQAKLKPSQAGLDLA
jgi:hypothetical protein